MPVFESESLVLRSYGLAEADRIVVFFTREHGVVRGVAKGAKRLRSRFGSTLELFSTVNLTYFQKEDRELVSVQQIELVRSRFALAGSPEYLHTFSYLADLITSIVPPHDPSEKVYRMTAACLDTALENCEDLAAVRLYFEMWLLRLGGFLPDWKSCGQCLRPFTDNQPATLRPDLHLICTQCRSNRHMTPVSTDHRKIFRLVQRLSPASFIENSGTSSEAISDLSAMMRRIVTQVVGRDLMNERTMVVNS